MSELLAIGEVARRTGTAPSTLRYYDEIGLLRPTSRVSGHRRYDPGVLRRLRIIAVCQRAGFSLEEIARLLGDAADWRDLAHRKLGDLQGKIDELEEAQQIVRAALACDCARLESCGRTAHGAIDRAYASDNSTRQETGRALLNAGPMPVEDWHETKLAMLDEMSGM